MIRRAARRRAYTLIELIASMAGAGTRFTAAEGEEIRLDLKSLSRRSR